MSTALANKSALSPRVLRQPESWLGLLVGVIAPLAAALLYHPYTLAMSSWPVELTRQLGLPFVAGEFVIILHARRRGLEIGALWRRMTPRVRGALTVFLATFWISSVTVSDHAPFSSALAVIWLIHLYTGAAVFHLAKQGRLDPRSLGAGLTCGLAALTLNAAFHLSFPPPGSGAETWQFGAPIPGFISVRLFGAWAGAVAVLLLGIAWRAEAEKMPAAWSYLGLGLAAGLVVWTGTRAALVAALVAIAVAGWTGRSGGPVRFWIKAGAAMLVGATLITWLMPASAAGSPARAGSSGRLMLWAETLRVAVHQPMLGHGMGANWWLVKLEGFAHVQPHNALIEFFMNWGVVPSAALIVLLTTACRHAYQAARDTLALLPFLMTVVYLLAASMFDGMLHFSEFLMLLAILLGIVLGTTVRHPDPDPGS